jgi:hypothetical protein
LTAASSLTSALDTCFSNCRYNSQTACQPPIKRWQHHPEVFTRQSVKAVHTSQVQSSYAVQPGCASVVLTAMADSPSSNLMRPRAFGASAIGTSAVASGAAAAAAGAGAFCAAGRAASKVSLRTLTPAEAAATCALSAGPASGVACVLGRAAEDCCGVAEATGVSNSLLGRSACWGVWWP